VLDSRSFFEVSGARVEPSGPSLGLHALVLLALLIASGCATVRPEDKEYLAEPSMTWSNASLAARQEAHVLDNREGSTGGGKTRGGGCGCN
jgi:hypothetical protein